MNIFRASEILKIAIQIEKNGLAFYTEVKNKTRHLPTQQVFDYLAEEEERHRQTFGGLLEKTGDYEPAESYPGEYQMYLEALAGENIFTNSDAIKQILKQGVSDKVAIDIGIGFEKDSIIFYGEIKKFVPLSDQNVVERVVGEEKEHLNKLIALKKKIIVH